MFVLLDNGYVITHVVDVDAKGVKSRSRSMGASSNRPGGVNILNAEVELPPMTEKDDADIRFGCEAGCRLDCSLIYPFCRTCHCYQKRF